MNMGQTMITTGMFVLLVMSAVSANRMLNQNVEITLQTEAMEISASVAEDLMAEASAKLFDRYDDGSGTQYPWDFGDCGPSSSEYNQVPQPDTLLSGAFKSESTFNDFDDYEGYQRKVTAGGISGFLVKSYVYYVDEYAPDIPSYWQSYFKRMEVRVSHPLYIVNKDGKSTNSDGSPVEIVYTTLLTY